MKKVFFVLLFLFLFNNNPIVLADNNSKTNNDSFGDLVKYHFTENDYATGSWHGARTKMEEHGVTINVDYTSDAFSKITGGLNNKFKAKYQGLLNFAITFDSEKLGLWKGGTLFIMGENVHGQGLTSSATGDFQTLSSIDVPRLTHIAEYWYQQSLINDRLKIKFGKQDANADFDAIDSGFGFVNSSFQMNPTVPMPTYSDQAIGIMMSASPFPSKDFSIKAGIYDGAPEGQFGFKSTFDEKNGCFVIVEPEFKYSFKNHPGKIIAGYWFHSGNVEEIPAAPEVAFIVPPGFDPPTIEPRFILSNQGAYFAFEQKLFNEHNNTQDDTQGLTFMSKFGYAPPNRNEVSRFFATGLAYQGIFPKRNDDIISIGVAVADFSGRVKTTDSRTVETAMELNYQAKLAKWLTLQPMFQIIFNPNGNLKDAYVLGLRTIINF